MKILQVIPFFSAGFGGSVKVLYQLSIELVKKGHTVTILTSDFGFDPTFAKEIEDVGVNVIPFKTVFSWGLFIYSPSIQTWLRDNINTFDVIHMHNFRSYQNNCVAVYAQKNNIPYLVQAHGSLLPVCGKRRLKKIYDLIWGNNLLKNAARIIAVSNTEKKQYQYVGNANKRIDIIPNGIDVSEYEALPERGKFRKKVGLGPDEKVIIYLGRIHKSKGIGFLLDGFASLSKQNNQVKLVIAGPDDGFLDNLVQRVRILNLEDRVFFPGCLYGNEKREAFIDADVLAYLGQIEIFGLVPFEAIMCGTPVIVTDGSGCGENVNEQNCGNVVSYGDVVGLVKNIIDIFNDPENSKIKVTRGQEYIRTQIDWHIIVSKFETIYANCREIRKT